MFYLYFLVVVFSPPFFLSFTLLLALSDTPTKERLVVFPPWFHVGSCVAGMHVIASLIHLFRRRLTGQRLYLTGGCPCDVTNVLRVVSVMLWYMNPLSLYLLQGRSSGGVVAVGSDTFCLISSLHLSGLIDPVRSSQRKSFWIIIASLVVLFFGFFSHLFRQLF